ncbi:cation-transporting P-type ATPase [Kribbella antibiotica]|uniref:Cation-transporting P-type ATPase n=1 Tax=Kribbella antibiotica TaxID=190195 RepID=A0A4R4ZRV6_9ACTN|nr:cation-transporting P-type ATPase [Kribbella antibiotica]TDD60659.1 cation-transporting P-type ATPase [Kribbella antibiotica]
MTLDLKTPEGLTDAAAAANLSEHGPNSIPQPAPPGVLPRVLGQLRDPMILILLAAAALTATLRDFTDLTVILLVVTLNTTVGVIQELRAEKALSALRQLAAPQARVIRSGRTLVLAADEVVPGDLALLEAGDVVPADLQLVTASRLQADEAALTGESVPVDKELRDDTPIEMSAGTVVTNGRGSGIVTRTGPDSALGQIAALLSAQRPRPTPLQRRLRSLSRTLTITALTLSALVGVSGLLRGRSVSEMLVTAVSLTVAAVPESLPAVVMLALALGAHRMAKKAAVVRSLPAVETLGAVTVIAADKTGTMTEGVMLAERLWTESGHSVAQGHGYAPDGSIEPVGQGSSSPAAMTRLLRDIVLCNDADLRPPDADHESWLPLGDPTEAALVTLAAKGGVVAADHRKAHPRTAEIPFDSIRKRMTTVHQLTGRDRFLVVCKGAPDVLLDGQIIQYGDLDAARAVAADLARQGLRVLAVADREEQSDVDLAHAESGLHLAGLIAITDPVRHNAAEVVAAFGNAGVSLLLITGDAPGTARAVADRIGLDPGDHVVTGTDIDDGLDPGPASQARVYARIRPEQKLDIVRAWQAEGQVVAMTGDGVNDAPALRRADIGVAMGKDGTEVARQAADLVLTNDDLGTVVTAIEEGRRIHGNVRTFLRYALSGGAAEVVVMLVGPLLGLTVPLLPAQILWINMLTHGLPGVALGAEPADPKAMSRGPRAPDEHVLGGGLWQRIAWTGGLISLVAIAAGVWAERTDGPWQTMTFIVLGMAQLGVVMALRRPASPGTSRVRFLDLAVAGAGIAQLLPLVFAPLRELLGLETLTLTQLGVALIVAAVPGLVVRVLRRFRSRG